jgi:ABC transporter substrate binding protein (PQQ-dependent alcohol dehydrogenase system)
MIILCILDASMASEILPIKIAILRQIHSLDKISIIDIPHDDDVIAGAKLGVIDNNTTGKFTHQSFEALDFPIYEAREWKQSSSDLVKHNISFIVADMPMSDLLQLSEDLKSSGAIIFNISATDDDLRNSLCRFNIIHTTPSRQMLTDALAEYLVWKQWNRWVLIKGSHKEDQLLTESYARSAKKFGAKIVEERDIEDTSGARRSDSGSVQTQRQIPLLTQGITPHNLIIAADEHDVFAGYLPYSSSEPNLIAGSAGLMPTSWDAAHEQWGAIQLQKRFLKEFNRTMNERDFNAWLAVRMIGEAANRTMTSDTSAILKYLLSTEFSIAAFKGSKLTIRDWDHQVRQPILLSDGKTVVSVSPQDGFLHKVTELDTLGMDKPETKCVFR